MGWLTNISNIHKIDPITEEVYNELIDFFDNESMCSGFRGTKQRVPRPTGNENLKEIAEEIYGYFSAHYNKARHTFIELERINNIETYIKQPLTIVDVGCGIGTASYALLDLIRRKYMSLSNPIKIRIIFIELSAIKSELLKRCVESYISKCPNVQLEYEIINIAFPNCIDEIKEFVKNQTNILLIMSNLVNWLKNDPYEMGKGIHKINMENPDVYDVKVINIEGHTLENKIKEQYNYLENKGVYTINGPNKVRESLTYINAIKSYWYEIRKNKTPYKNVNSYVHGSVKSIPLIKAVSSKSMLEIAFFKARHAHRSIGITDELEIKYTESNLNNIIRLIKDELDKGSGYQYSNDFLEYKSPKNDKDVRPLVIEDFINDIVSTSLIITMGDNIDEEQDLLRNVEYSFGNRLSDELKSPYIFKPFTQKYFNEYIAKAKDFSEDPSNSYCVQADIKSFYTMIDKGLLKDIVDKTIPDTIKWVKNTLYSYIDRIFDGCKSSKGLPQGVFLSNLLANLYLTKLDSKINSFGELKYVRYVDDFFIFSQNKKAAEEIDENLKKIIEGELQLKINLDKSGVVASKDLIWPGNEIFFRDIKIEIDRILRSIYKLDNKNYKKYKKNPEEFINSLHECLSSINIYIPKNWLQIKIEGEVSFLDRMLKRFRSKSIFLNWAKKKIFIVMILNGGISP